MGYESTPRWRLSWRIWLTVFCVWTTLLITPGNWFPGSVATSQVGGIGVAKLLHIGAFAVLAGSAGWLPNTLRQRTMISFAMILHGGLTELIQTQVPYREGSWRDVAIDTVGVIVGYLTTRWRWPA